MTEFASTNYLFIELTGIIGNSLYLSRNIQRMLGMFFYVKEGLEKQTILSTLTVNT